MEQNIKASDEDTTPKVVDADKSSKDDELLRSVRNDFNAARRYVKQNYQSTWEKSFKAYNGIRTHRDYTGNSDDFVPETFAIVESLKSSIAGTKPKFKYMPLTEEQEQDTDTLNSLVDFYWSQNNMTEKMLNGVGDMIIYGNGVFMVSWEQDKPLIQHIPLADFFVDPTATHLNRPEEPGYARYAGYRYLTSIDSLRAETVLDPETNEQVPKYKNLDDIRSSSRDDDQMDKDRKEQFLGSVYGKEAFKEEVEVIVYFTRRKKIMIANRDVIILEESNPYHKPEETITQEVIVNEDIETITETIPEIQGFLPFAILRNYVDSNLFFARGDVEIMLPSQEALNDTANQKRDNVAYALNNMWRIDPRFAHMAEHLKSGPGVTIPIPRGALEPLDKQDVSSSADTEIERLRQQMRSTSAADAAVQGTQQRYSRTTATEVQAQLQQASTRFTTKVQTLEDEGFAQLARILFKMIMIFVENPTAVRIAGRKGITWKTYRPGEYKGEYEPRVILESTAKSEKQAIANQLQAVMQFGLNNPLVNQQALLRQAFKHMLDDLSDDDIEEMLTVEQPIMGPDGQAIDPSLQQGDALMTPGAAEMMAGMGGEQRSFNDTTRGRMTQSGRQGGGGADSGSNNIRRIRQNQPSEALPLTRPGA